MRHFDAIPTPLALPTGFTDIISQQLKEEIIAQLKISGDQHSPQESTTNYGLPDSKHVSEILQVELAKTIGW